MLGSFRRPFEDDPFFSMHNERLRGADDIFSSFFSSDPFLPIAYGSEPPLRQQGSNRRMEGRSSNHNFGGSMDLMMAHNPNPFDSMNAMMRNMHHMMGNLSQQTNEIQNDPDAHVYSQSSVMSYSNMGNNQQPKFYQATSATRQMPGGLRETRKAVRDSEAALEKMAVGRHINDRGNVITRQRDMRTGDMDENRDFINMDEEDAPRFENEWQQRTTQSSRNAIGHQNNRNVSIDNGRTRHHKVPAVESTPRESRHHRSSRHK